MRQCPNYLSSRSSGTSRRFRLPLAVVSVVFLGYRAPLARAQERSSEDLRRLNQSVDALVKRVSPSVLQILVSGTLERLRGALKSLPPGAPVALQIQRGQKLLFLAFTLDCATIALGSE